MDTIVRYQRSTAQETSVSTVPRHVFDPDIREMVFQKMDTKKTLSTLDDDYRVIEKMKSGSWLGSFVSRFREPKRNKLLRKSVTQVDKELDLQKIIHRLRLLLMATLGSLTPEQSVYVDTMSHVVIRESSDLDYTSSDKELDEVGKQKNFMFAAQRMISSTSPTDQRLINIFRVQKNKQFLNKARFV